MQSNVIADNAQWLSMRDAGVIYGLSRASWYRLLSAGEIEAVKLGRRCTRLDRRSIDAFFERRAEKAAA